MQPVEIPKFRTLHGEKAIKALYDFINELEAQKGEELTEKQTIALIKIAKGVISSIEAETLSGTLNKSIKEALFGRLFKKNNCKIFSKISQQTFRYIGLPRAHINGQTKDPTSKPFSGT